MYQFRKIKFLQKSAAQLKANVGRKPLRNFVKKVMKEQMSNAGNGNCP